MKTSTPVHLPDTIFRLWVTAERIVEDKNLVALDEADRERLPLFLHDSEESEIVRPLDKPWEIVVHDETYHLAPELEVKAWVDVEKHFDGKVLHIGHHMPIFKATSSEIREGETIVAENYLWDNETKRYYDVKLHIHWPKQDRKGLALGEALEAIEHEAKAWEGLSDEEYEIVAFLVHHDEPEEEYKAYPPSCFPAQFAADLNADAEVQKGLQQIAVQVFSIEREYCDYSDDYKAAAGISDDEDTGWYSTRRKPTDKRLSYTIG